MAVSFLAAEVVAPAGTAESAAVAFGQGCNQCVLAVDVNVGAGVESVTLTVYGRSGAGSWRAVNVCNLDTQLGDLVSSVQYTADYASENALLVPTPIDELKVSVTNNGATNATVNVTGFMR